MDTYRNLLGKERANVAQGRLGYRTTSQHADAGRCTVQDPQCQGGRGCGSCRADAAAFHHCTRVAGVWVIQHDNGGRALQPMIDVARETGDPLDTHGTEISVSHVCGQGDDAIPWRLREPEEVTVGVLCLAVAMHQIDALDQVNNFFLSAVEKLVDRFGSDDDHAVTHRDPIPPPVVFIA
ncbi:hypothetical protein SDC9_49495 [bioreactor metagenome]|uniref:Uncharacterized protein n=1 Tax=bioreactor metagenome TaxID=1076179 RepID=A0A644WHI6_9ZZZZ